MVHFLPTDLFREGDSPDEWRYKYMEVYIYIFIPPYIYTSCRQGYHLHETDLLAKNEPCLILQHYLYTSSKFIVEHINAFGELSNLCFRCI